MSKIYTKPPNGGYGKKQRDLASFKTCSHGGGRPQVGEVPHLPVVKER